MVKKKTKKVSYGLDTNAACLRAAMTTGLSIAKINGYVSLIYKALHIKKASESYQIFLQRVNKNSAIEKICTVIIEHPASDEFFEVVLALIRVDPIAESNRQDLKSVSTEGFSETPGGNIKIGTHLRFPAKNPLKLINCELKTHKFDNSLEVQYIESAEEPFDLIQQDFKHGTHLESINEIYENENNDVPDRLLIVCDNKYTGLLACKYLSALIDTSNEGPFSEENEGFSFEDKVPVIPASEIAPLFSDYSSTNSFGYNYQYSQNQKVNHPWWLHPESEQLPIIVMINKGGSLPDNFTEKMRLLDSHPYIFVVYEKDANQGEEDIVSLFGSNVEQILNDFCFKLNYKSIHIPEPEIDGTYMQEVLITAANQKGYSLSDDLDRPQLLKRLQTFCRRSFEGNSSVVHLINNAVSRKKGNTKILTSEDFSYLDSNLVFPMIQEKNRVNTTKKSAAERLKAEIYGLEVQKQKILQAMNLLRLRKARNKAGIKTPDVSPVFLFYGPPGTCKSRFAELMGEWMCEEGLLPGNRMISGNAVSLCKGEFVGQTGPKTRDVFEKNDVIFLDEIYSTALGDRGGIDSYSQELLAELCIQLEKVAKNCDKLVIMAGYAGGDVSEENNLVQQWLAKNPGIASRITFHIAFNAYSPEIDMPNIFSTIAKNADVDLEDGWQERVIPFFQERALEEDFGNGREARRLLNNAMLAQASRLDPDTATIAELRLITCEDIEKAIYDLRINCGGIKGIKLNKTKIGF